MLRRKTARKILDFTTFPLRALLLHEKSRFWGTSLADERFDYVAREVQGYCLDIGCGRYNRFIDKFLNGNGIGIDVYLYEGLSEKNIVESIECLPYPEFTFDSVTFIACLNHAPRNHREAEIAEAYRVLKPDGKIVITMGLPLAEIAAHTIASLYSWLFPWYEDTDTERGMDEEEDYYVSSREILRLLNIVGFKEIGIEPFITQWGLNRLYFAKKILNS